MIWKAPCRIVIVSGRGEGNTPLSAFDKALLNAEIGNLNLIKVSSIVPAEAKVLKLKQMAPLKIAPGTLVPAVCTHITSDTVGERIASLIAIGKPCSKKGNGIIFEVSLVSDLATARNVAESMVKESFKARGSELDGVIVEGAEAIVSNGTSCVVAAALMLP